MSEFLYTIPYSSFDLWDVKRYSKITYTSRYSIEPLGRHIRSEIEKINLPDFPEETFSILGISNEIGMHDAYDKKGKEFNQPYKIVKDGFLAYNPYRVNVGSIGIKTPTLKGNLISPAYVVFSCRETILPEYLFLLMKTNMFNKQVKENTSGSVRQNLTYDALASIKIPVPSISVQSEIVQTYNTDIEISKSMVSDYITGINSKLSQTYELVVNLNSDSNLLKFVDFKEMSRWDVENISSKIHLSANVPLRKISEFIKSWMEDENGSLGLNSMDYPDELFSYLGMENVDKNTGKLVALHRVRGKEIKSTTLRVPKDYIIYNKLRPYLNKYWINADAIEKVICSSEFFVFDINGINREYFIYILSSSFVQKQLELQYSGARMPRINKDIFFNVKIPVPNYEEQERVVKVLNEIKQNYEQKKMESKELEAKAKQDFENVIFEK